jgi:serine/threonine protein kinase
MSLVESLRQAQKKDGFVSIAAMKRIVTQEAIQKYFETHSNAHIDNSEALAKSVASRNLKLFAVLLYSGLDEYLDILKSGDITDDILPIGKGCDLPIRNEKFFEDIIKSQWIIAPFWNTDAHLDPPDDISFDSLFKVLPRPHGVDNSSYGTIEQVEIAQDHLEGCLSGQVRNIRSNLPLVTDTKQRFARKTMSIFDECEGRTEDIIRREAETLRRRKHKYIIPIIVSYTHYWRSTPHSAASERQIVIICPWYPCSMESFMKSSADWIKHNETGLLRKSMYELVYQVIQGLAYLHKPQVDQHWTCHHDLKPANILMKESGVVLADFGMTHLKPFAEGSEATSGRNLGTRVYCPPEAFDEDGSRISRQHGRAFDMWSLGCIMIEIAVIMSYGWENDKLQEFRKQREQLDLNRRPFPKHLNNNPAPGIKSAFYNSIPVVDDWMSKLQCPRVEDVAEVWKLARYLRLAVGMLRTKPSARVFSWEAVLDFYDILHPDASDVDRLILAKQFVQAPNKSPGKDRPAETPLHRAAEIGDFTRVVCLADASWSITDADANGRSPIDIAENCGHTAIAQYLKKKAVQNREPQPDILPTVVVHEMESSHCGFSVNKAARSKSNSPLPNIWGSGVGHPEPPMIPDRAKKHLQEFVSCSRNTILYFWGLNQTHSVWLYPSSCILAHMMKKQNNHVILLDLDNDTSISEEGAIAYFARALIQCLTDLPFASSTRSMVDLEEILKRYAAPQKPIVIIILSIEQNPDTKDNKTNAIEELLPFIVRNCACDGDDINIFKFFLCSESWLGYLAPLLKDHEHFEVRRLKQRPLTLWGQNT